MSSITSGDAVAFVIAVAIIPIGGLIAATDSALAQVSVARVDEMVREGVRGAKSLRVIVADRARYTNLLLLLRVTC